MQGNNSTTILTFIKQENRPVTYVELQGLQLNSLDSELQGLIEKNLM